MIRVFLLLFCFLLTISYACSGNCISCHKILKKSINKSHHKILKECITCHNKLPSSMSECGGDCFSCHSQNRLINSEYKSHKKLKSCKKCHISKEDFLSFKKNQNSSFIDLLNNK